MKQAIILVAVVLLPTSSSAQPNHSRQANHSRHGSEVGQEKNPSMVFIGQDGRMVDMKKDKCWDPMNPYHAPGWC